MNHRQSKPSLMVERPSGVDLLVPGEVAADVVAELSLAADGLLDAAGAL